jgi:endoglucanase
VWDFYLGNGWEAYAAYEEFLDEGKNNKADLMAKIAFTPMAQWFGDWAPTARIAKDIDRHLSSAERQGKPAVIVLYAINERDCGGYSGGGFETGALYLEWIEESVKGFKGREPWVILEPDGLAMIDEPECKDKKRAETLAEAIEILSNAGGRVYLDIANSGWKSVDDRVELLNKVGTDNLYGFSTNVANTIATEIERKAGDAIAKKTGLRYVIDTSRNGNGSNGEWCNPEGRALGELPRMVNEGALDAYLWIKSPGWSDGECNDGPVAGKWYLEYALELARNAN